MQRLQVAVLRLVLAVHGQTGALGGNGMYLRVILTQGEKSVHGGGGKGIHGLNSSESVCGGGLTVLGFHRTSRGSIYKPA
jgi:hypothetical protein